MFQTHEWVIDPEKVAPHEGHDIAVVTYANENLAIECETCYEVLADIDYEEVPDADPVHQ